MIYLQDFLNKIFSPEKGKPAPVFIYDWIDDFYPERADETALISVYRSDYKVEAIYNERLCKAEVKEIYWTENGIVLTVRMGAKS